MRSYIGGRGQLSDQPSDPDAPGNLFEPVTGAYGAHGCFDDQARTGSWEMVASRHHKAVWAAVFIVVAVGAHLLAKRLKI